MKKVLLIGGGGTLGTYTSKELISLGYDVDVICLEDKVSENENLKFYKAEATNEYLGELFKRNHYDGIVNFIHYPEVETYKPVHKLLSENTDHLIFLSSYRVYADLEHPVTENAPMLLDVSDDEEFLKNEKYALSKAKAEKFLLNESNTDNWTAVRPVISISQYRMDLVTRGGHDIIEAAKNKTPLSLPKVAKELTAGVDWSGNTGKLIANLLFKDGVFREAYTISSAQNLKWGQVADIYTELTGAEFEWLDTEAYLKVHPIVDRHILKYDRFFDRQIDNSKVLKATGLSDKDFLSIREGIKIELDKIGFKK